MTRWTPCLCLVEIGPGVHRVIMASVFYMSVSLKSLSFNPCRPLSEGRNEWCGGIWRRETQAFEDMVVNELSATVWLRKHIAWLPCLLQACLSMPGENFISRAMERTERTKRRSQAFVGFQLKSLKFQPKTTNALGPLCRLEMLCPDEERISRRQ